jgi:hypothetical protein
VRWTGRAATSPASAPLSTYGAKSAAHLSRLGFTAWTTPLWTLVLLRLAGLLAGWVDAVVGGGSRPVWPALVIRLPGASPVQILATNKIRGRSAVRRSIR